MDEDTTFVLTDAEYEQLEAALNAPPKVLPRLAELLNSDSDWKD